MICSFSLIVFYWKFTDIQLEFYNKEPFKKIDTYLVIEKIRNIYYIYLKFRLNLSTEWILILTNNFFWAMALISMYTITTISHRPGKKMKKNNSRGIIVCGFGLSKCPYLNIVYRSFTDFIIILWLKYIQFTVDV